MNVDQRVQIMQELDQLREWGMVRRLDALHVVGQERPPVPLLSRLPPPEVVPRMLCEGMESVNAQSLAQLTTGPSEPSKP